MTEARKVRVLRGDQESGSVRKQERVGGYEFFRIRSNQKVGVLLRLPITGVPCTRLRNLVLTQFFVMFVSLSVMGPFLPLGVPATPTFFRCRIFFINEV